MKNNIDELKEKIIDSATEEADILVSRAEKAKERVLFQAREEEKKIKEEAEEKGKILFNKEKTKIISKKKMNEKRSLLILRKQIFEMLLFDLKEELISMLKKGKLDSWIISCCKEVLKEEKKASLIAGREYIDLFQKICCDIKNLGFTEEPIDAGFLIRVEEEEYDFRFSILAGNIIKENKKMIADNLGVNYG